MKRILAALLLAGSAMTAHAVPKSIQTTWLIYKGSMKVATVTERFEQSAGHYKITSETRPAGVLALVSHETITALSYGRINGNQLVPDHFEQRRSQEQAKTILADFDWEHGTLNMKHDGHTELVRLPAGTQDQLSFFYQIMFNQPTHGSFLMHMTTGKKLQAGQFKVMDARPLATAIGTLPALHLARQASRDEKGMEIWLATSKEDLPVRVILEDKGDSLEQKITSAEITN